MSKTKNIELGKVMKPNGKAFFSFDNNITEIQITRKVKLDGEDVTEVVKVAPNGEYLSGGFINKFEDNVNFKLDKEWITPEKAESDLAYGKDKGISSIFSIKVESK